MNQNAGIRNKLILWALCLCLALGAAFAVAEPAEPVTEAPVVTADTVTPAINDAQAAAGFITQVMTGRKLTPPKPRGTVSGDQLTGREALVYAALKPQIQQAAKGQLESTEFRIPVKDIYEDVRYTAADLGVDYIYDSSGWNQAAKDAFAQKTSYDFSLVNRALLYDLPYDLYWFDKTVGVSRTGVAYTSDGTEMWIADYDTAVITYKYCVSSDYAVNHVSKGYALDTSYGARAVTAGENARSVVETNQYKSDLHKLQAYKEYICGEVTYNTAAADDSNNTPYGDPWQLVNVFDGDPETNVVCEGYSKAFQFLCDESRFRNGTSVVSVSGTMAGGTGAGGHMWNIVTMPDGLHYMADITNSDSGSVGQNGGLFLNGYTTSVPANNQYNYTAGGKTIAYVFDANTLQLLSETGMLAMAENDYVPSDLDEDSPTVTEITPLNIPESIQVGEDLPVEVIWPSGWQRAEIHLKRSAEAWLDNDYFSYDAGNPTNVTTWTARAESMLGAGLQPDTTIFLEFIWYDAEDNEHGPLTVNIQVTGELPVMPTAEGPVTAEVGDTILLTGTAGSADSLTLSWYDGDSHDETLSIDAEGNWSFQVTLNAAQAYNFSVLGRTSEGLYTGRSSVQVYVDSDSSLSAPVFGTPETEENQYTIDILPAQAPDGETEVQWYYTVSLRDEGSRSQLYNTGDETDGHLHVDGGLTYADEVTITAMYLLDDAWSRPGSVTFTVPGEPYPVNGYIEYELEIPKTLPAGTDLVIDWEPVVDGMRLSLEVFVTNESGERLEHVISRSAYNGESIIVDDYRLNEGLLYELSFYAEAETYLPTPKKYVLEVVPNPDLLPAPTDIRILDEDGNELTEEGRMNLYLGAVGSRILYPQAMQQVELQLCHDMENGYSSIYFDRVYTVWGSSSDWSKIWNINYTGDWHIRVRVQAGDAWSAWSDPVRLRVVSYPTLATPTVTADKEALTIGEPLTLTVTDIDPNTVYLEVTVFKSHSYGRSFENPPAQLTLTIPEEAFSVGTTEIIVYVSGEKQNGASVTFPVQVTGQRPAAPAVTFSATSANVGETIYATVEASEASQVQMGQDNWDDDVYFSMQDGSARIPFTVDYYSNENWNKSYRFRVLVNGIWSDWTDSYQISSLTEQPSFEGKQYVEMPEAILSGQDVIISLKPVEGITRYAITVSQGDIIFTREYCQPEMVLLPAALFADGDSFGFVVTAGDPYNPNLLRTYYSYEVNPVSDPVGHTLSISAAKTTLFYGEETEVSLSVPAEKVIWQTYGWDGRNRRGWMNPHIATPADGEETLSAFHISFPLLSGREYPMRVTALVNGEWTAWSNILTFTVNPKEFGLLSNPVAQVDAEIPEGTPVLVSWEAVNHAESYKVSWRGVENGVGGSLTTTALSLAIPPEQLPMGNYLVYITSEAVGYDNDSHYIQVPFTVTQAPPVGDIELAEDLPEITMFEPFSVMLQPAEHATWYSAVLMYQTGSDDTGTYSSTAVETFLELDTPATAPVTLTLENWNEDARPTDCWLWIEAGADGYIASTKAFYNLTVHEAESLTAPTDIQILGSNGSALTEEERLRMQQGVVPVQITYPQPMQQVKLEIRKEDSSGSENVVLSRTFSMEDPATVWTSGNALAVIYGEGNYSILAQVMVDEVWSPWSEPLRLTMLPPPQLSAPAVEADKEAMILGEPLALTITEIDPNAEFLFFRIQGEGSQEIHEFERTDLTDPFVITIPADQFFEGANTITVMAGAESYKGGSAELTIQVTALPAPQVEYSALGGETGDTVYATVTAPGADLVEMSQWPKYYAVQDGTVRIPILLGYYSNMQSYYKYKFRARVDGIWTAWTEETTLTVSDLPQLTGDIVDLPEEILPGQDVEITFLPVEGITRYDLAISYPSGSYFRQVYEEPGTITLPGILFVNGGSFTFNVRGGDAYAQRLLYENKDYQIAQGTNPGGLEITASKTELAYGETIDVSLNCGAAEQVIIQAYVTLPYGYHVWVCANKIDMQALGLTSSVPLTLNTTGEYPIRAAALVNGEWIGWSNTLTFNLSAPGEQPLENPVPRVDAEIPEGTPAHITWDAVENAETYTVSWRCVKTGATGTDVTSDPFLDIPAEKLSQGDWLVSVTSQAPGYRSGEYLPQVPFTVTQAPPVGDIELAEDLPEITMFEPFSVTLQPAEHATWYSAVLMYQTGSDDTGTYSSTAVETFLELDASATTPVTLTLEDWNADAPVGGTYWLWIEAGADGYVTSTRGFYNLTIHEPPTLIPAPIGLSVPTEWPAGKDLTLEWVSLPGVANQDGTLYFDRLGVGDDDWDRWYMSSYLHLKTDTSIILNGYKLEEGAYEITAILQADGYETNTVTYPLTITANPDQPAAPVLTLEADPLYVNIPAWITLNQEYDEIYCKYLSTEGGFGDDRSSSGDSFRILAEEALNYRVTVSGRIGDVWSPAGRLMVTAEETPAIQAIQVLRAPETIRAGDGMVLEVLWPDGWDTAFVGIKRDGFGSLYANTFHQDIYMPSPYTYVSVQPDSLTKVMAGDTLSIELFCLDNKGSQMDSITLQVQVTGEAVRTMTLPAALTEIEAEAFAGTGAQRIEIPATCTAVGSRAFADSDSLLEVVVRGADTVIPADVFDGCGQKISLWLPSRNSSWEAFRGNPMVAVSFLK